MNKSIFTRREVLSATKSTSNQLQYLERKGLISPHRVGKGDRPIVLFSLEQMMAIALNKKLKNIDDNCADSLVKFIADFDKPKDFNYAGTPLYCIDGVTAFDLGGIRVCRPLAMPTQYRLAVIWDLGEILAEIVVNAKNSEIIDFESFRDRIIS